MNAIIANHLFKSFEKGKIKALEDISFEVKQSELFGLIGPDGAGKTTLFRILATLLLAESGDASVDGLDVKKDYKAIRKRVGYMPGKFSLYQDLSVEENLNFFAHVFGTTIEQNYHLIKDIYQQLEPFKTRKAGKLSGGMKQKLALCCALIHEPSVLFLDEPTTGVDPVSRKEFWEMLKYLKSEGITILVSTPYMDEASLCDRVALMQKGKILDIDTPVGIIEKYPKKIWSIHAPNMYALLQVARAFPNTHTCFGFGESHHLTLKNDDEDYQAFCQYVQTHYKEPFQIQEITATIEDCFMALS
ncbi:ABC transporter ATP-binding protein [Cellulophaga sp. BC115SP]|uniref:ABC transporter ATP-binding protein n=1 Tax=Cellulophaga sp. BC115SP TaxID=2683263 RepID=UPI00141273D4|nr:ABC transporter ATP-binding protein [Cellulophaga sp. BC115SP]NBB27816.1 ATP-binding cassette domain-containing protein [Cellulophaga sp. BC115SP]